MADKRLPMDLRITVAGICALQVLLGARALWVWLDSPERYSSAIAGGALYLLAVGLWRMHAWARSVTEAILWFLLFALPTGYILVEAEGGRTLGSILLRAVPAWFATLWCLHVLRKHKGSFGKAGGRPMSAGPGNRHEP
jgi:hypothetical protein